MSNAPLHIIEERTRLLLKANEPEVKEAETNAIRTTIMRYINGIKLSKLDNITKMEKPENLDTLSWVKYFAIKEIRISQIIEEMTQDSLIHTERIITEIKNKNRNICETKQNFETPINLRMLIDEFRNMVKQASKDQWEDIEIMLNQDIQSVRIKSENQKKNVGRPLGDKAKKKKEEEKTKPKQMVLEQFFK